MGSSNFTSQLLAVKILCLVWIEPVPGLIERRGQRGMILRRCDLDNEPFLSFPSPDAPEDKSSQAPRTAPREQRKQKRSHQFRSSLIPKIVELFIQHRHRV